MCNTAEMPYVKKSPTKIFRGEYCGVCHDRVAFTTMFACERCHSVLHRDSGNAWWVDPPPER